MSLSQRRLLYVSPEFPKLRHGFEASELVSLAGEIDVSLLSLRSPSQQAIGWWQRGFRPKGTISLSHVSLLPSIAAFVRWSIVRPRTVSHYFSWAIRLSRYDVRGAMKVLLSLIAGCATATKAKRLSATWIHADFSSAPATAAMIASALVDVPFSFCGHAFDVFSTIPAGDATRPALARKLTEAGVVFAANSACATRFNEIANEYGAEPRIVLKRNGVQSLSAPLDRPRADCPPVLVGLGALVAKKGFDVLIRAAAIVRSRYPHVSVRLAGEGPERHALAALAHDLEVPLDLTGAFDHADLPVILKNASLVAVPSRVVGSGDSDGVPTVFIEALAYGCPVIGTQVGAVTDLILHGETGWIVPSDDPSALAVAIFEVLGDANRARQLALHGRALVEREFMAEDAARLLVQSIEHSTIKGED